MFAKKFGRGLPPSAIGVLHSLVNLNDFMVLRVCGLDCLSYQVDKSTPSMDQSATPGRQFKFCQYIIITSNIGS
jgi:hypothetical protein